MMGRVGGVGRRPGCWICREGTLISLALHVLTVQHTGNVHTVHMMHVLYIKLTLIYRYVYVGQLHMPILYTRQS